MKFAIAAGILAQTLPAVSTKVANFFVQEWNHDMISVRHEADESMVKASDKRRARRSLAVPSKMPRERIIPLMNQRRFQGTVKFCDPFSQDPDIGILSCGAESVCKHSKNSWMGGRCESKEGNKLKWSKAFASLGKGRVMKNIKEAAGRTAWGTMECIPDTGILSCGEGQYCEASSASSMGGFCMERAASRHLYHLAEDTDICNPTSDMYMYYDCDCSGFDNATGTGEIPCTLLENYCLGLVYTGCGDACVTRTVRYSFSNFTAPSYSSCFEFTTPSAQKVCFEELFEANSCSITFDDQSCTSCVIVPDGNYTSLFFDCSNAGGGKGTTYYGLAELLPIIDACYTRPSITECTLCTAQNTIFNPNSLDTDVSVAGVDGNFTCYTLFYNAYKYTTISEDYCPMVAAAAAEACCVSYCEVCGPGNYIPPSNYPIEPNSPIFAYEGATCGDIAIKAYYNFTITDEACASASAAAQEVCCVPLVVESCKICNGPMVNPNAMISFDGSTFPCSLLKQVMNETACAAALPIAVPICCNGGGTENGASPAPTPVPGQDIEPQATFSAATSIVTKSIMSMVGFAAGVVAF